MSIIAVATKNDIQIASGAQYNYDRGKLFPFEGEPIEFNKYPINKQSSQYAYTNENPISILAQASENYNSFGANMVMLMSGARNSIETKVFIGPRNTSFIKMELYDDESDVKVEFSGEDFESLLNNNQDKFISIVYTQISNDLSYELDLHTDITTYEDAVNYSSLDYLETNNYPHFNQIKYSSRIVSKDDFISESMGIRNTIEYNPHFGNYYIRPDFVKAFKGFKILGKANSSLEIQGTSTISLATSSMITEELSASLTNVYYDDLVWNVTPNLPGIKLLVSSDTHNATLKIYPTTLKTQDLYTDDLIISVYGRGLIAYKEIVLTDVATKPNNVDVYIANPSIDPNPWYDIQDYLDLDEAYKMRADSYLMSTSSSDIRLDQSNHRFKYIGSYDNFNQDIQLNWTYTSEGNQDQVTTLTLKKLVNPITRSGMVLTSKIKVLDWIKCDESKVNISSSTDNTCTLSSNSDLISIKAKTLHGTFLYREE